MLADRGTLDDERLLSGHQLRLDQLGQDGQDPTADPRPDRSSEHLVRRTIATNLMLITLQTLSVFGLIYTMTKGGPSEKSMTLPLFAYNVAFVSADLGYGTAIALLLLVIGGIFSVIYLRALSKSEPVR